MTMRLAASLFGDGLELGDRLEILDAPGRTLDLNQAFKREAATLSAEEGQRVGTAAGDFSEKVDRAGVGHQRKV